MIHYQYQSLWSPLGPSPSLHLALWFTLFNPLGKSVSSDHPGASVTVLSERVAAGHMWPFSISHGALSERSGLSI